MRGNKKVNKPDISVIEASIDSLSKELVSVKSSLNELQKTSWNIVIGVAVAFLIALSLGVWEIVMFHTRSDNDLINIQKQTIQLEYRLDLLEKSALDRLNKK